MSYAASGHRTGYISDSSTEAWPTQLEDLLSFLGIGAGAESQRRKTPAVPQELPHVSSALTVAMESTPERKPKIDVREAPDGVLEVIIRTIGDNELERLRRSERCAPKRVH